MLEFRLAGDDVFFPAVGEFQVAAQGGVEALSALLLQHPLAVGGIGDEDAGIAGQAHLGGVAVPEGDQPVHPRLFGVGHGQRYALGIVVGAKDAVIALELLIPHFRAHVAPNLRLHPGEGLGGEPAVHAGSLVPGDQRRLNGDGAAAAEAVPQEFPAPVVGQGNHGGGQGLPQGGVVAVGPVAPLVQPRAGGIQIQLHPVIHDGKLQLEFIARLRQPAHAVFFSQATAGRLLDDGLTVRHAHELAVQAVALHGERAVLGDIALQRAAVHALEQLLEAARREVRQDDQHPLAGAQAHIGLGHGPLVPGKQDTPVFHPDVLQAHSFQLVPRQALQAEQAGNGKFHLIHTSSYQGMILLFFRYRSSSEKTQPQYFWI